MIEPCHQELTPRRRLAFYASLLAIPLLSACGVTGLYSMLPQLFAHFAPAKLVGWVVTAYWLGAAVTAAVVGRLGDTLGHRRMALIVVAISAAGAALAATSSHLAQLVLGCAVESIAITLTPLAYGLMRQHLPEKEVSLAISLLSTSGMVMGGLMFVSAGAVVDAWTWRAGFVLQTGVAAMLGLALWLGVPSPAPKAPGFQANAPSAGEGVRWIRGLLFAPAIAALLWCMTYPGALDSGHPVPWAVFFASIALLGGWALDQSRQPRPLVDVRLFKQRQILLACLCMTLVAMGGMQVGQLFSMLFQQPSSSGVGLGLTATQSGTWMLVSNLLALLAGPASGWVAQRRGARSATIQGLLLLALTWGWVTWSHQGAAAAVIGLLACSFALSYVQPGVFNLVVEAAPPGRVGEASGLLFVLFACFFAAGSQISFAWLNSAQEPATATLPALPSALGYTRALGWGAVCSVIALLLALSLPKRLVAAQGR